MKALHQRIFRAAAVGVGLMTFLISPELPSGKVFEANQAASVRPRSEHARTMPISNKVITVKFTGGDEQSVLAAQFEGGLIRVEIPGKATYGFSLIVSDLVKGTIAIKVYRIGLDGKSGEVVVESLTETETLIVEKVGNKNLTTYADGDENFKMEIVGIRTASEERWEAVKAQMESNLMADCCVWCGGRQFCSCWVATPCGGCCDGACCHLTQ